MDTAVRTRALSAGSRPFGRAALLPLAANALGLVALLTLLFTVPTGQQALRLGSVADETIIARHKATFIDHQATAARKKQAMETVPAVYVPSTALAIKRVQQARAFFSAAQPIIALKIPATKKLDRITALVPSDISNDQLQQFAELSPADFNTVRVQSLALLNQAVDWHFAFNQLPATEIGLVSTIATRVTSLQRAVIGEVLSTFLEPTLVEDTQATVQRQNQKARTVAPVMRTIYPGEVVVRRGDLVTAAVMEELSALGLHQRRLGWQEVTAAIVFAALIVLMLFWYLHAFHTGIVANPRLLLLVDASVLVAIIGARFLAPSHVLLPFLLPIAAAPTFAAVLLGPEAAIALALAMAILTGWITADSYELTTYYFLTSAAGVLAVRHVRQVKQFIFAGGSIMVFAGLTMLAFGLVDHNYDLGALQDYAVAAVINGFVSSTLALGGFALLAGYFGVTTTLQLLELAQPSQPLLRRLMLKAPGTYNHSLILGSMVEHAAEEIGGDSLIAKLGALYHDVGKTANPHCFVENQLGMGNIHDELRPDESARLIRGHVIQGLRLARQHKLPRVVLDAIAEHHGTMSIAYFLHRAREYSDEPIDISLYTYPGPKPQSKETALIMLADGCESAVRASLDKSGERMREIVDRIFQERIDLGQLSECPLTLRDLELARGAFLSVLTGLYHPRVDYPEPTPEVPIDIREHGIAR